MKRCPKCSRTFPDDNQKFCTIDGGLLVAGDKPFDPNATIASTSARTPPPQPPGENESDLGATIATSSSAPTAVLPKRTTGPTGSPTASNLHQQQQPQAPSPPPVAVSPALAPTVTLPPTPSAPLPPAPGASLPPTSLPPTPSGSLPGSAVAPPKKSKLPLILGILAILLILGMGAVVAAFFLVIKPRLPQARGERPVVISETPTENVNNNNNTNANTNAEPTKPETTEFVAPPDTTKFTNSSANLDPKLAEHYFDFSFYYPNSWEADPKAGVQGNNFAKVERRLPPDFTQENFAVGWYNSKGTFADDESTFPQLVERLSASLAKNFPEYRKVSEGPTKVNSLDGYEFRFESTSRGSEKGDIQLWGRVIFLPTGVSGETAGATLVMLATSLAPELSGVDDVGVNGQMPVILESFRFGKRQ